MLFVAYGELRRRRLKPTAYTLNALLQLEARGGDAEAASRTGRLLRRSSDPARWPGDAADAWDSSSKDRS